MCGGGEAFGVQGSGVVVVGGLLGIQSIRKRLERKKKDGEKKETLYALEAKSILMLSSFIYKLRT